MGFLYLLKGRLIAAETGQLKNLEAAYRIISWEEPIIEIEKEVKKTVNEINMPLMNILMDGLRVKDESLAGRPPAESVEDQNEIEAEDDLFLSDEELDLENEGAPLQAPESAWVKADSGPMDYSIQPGKRMPDAVIAERILAFQNKIAIPCPLCALGKILLKTSAEKIPYFACSNAGCSFISRQKPYRLSCPECNNPFLIEFMVEGSNTPGLKCPRLECSFRQNSLTPPARNPLREPPDESTKRTVRVIRRKPS